MIEDSALLQHIRDAALKILEYSSPGREVFLADPMRQDAVIRNFEIIGEASKNLSENLRSVHSDVPWREIARMRDKLIHHYFGVKVDVVWRTIEADLPPLLTRIESILKSIPESPPAGVPPAPQDKEQ